MDINPIEHGLNYNQFIQMCEEDFKQWKEQHGCDTCSLNIHEKYSLGCYCGHVCDAYHDSDRVTIG